MTAVDEIDALRGAEYALLSVLLGQAPTADLLARVSGLRGDATPLGLAHLDLANAAQAMTETLAGREFFNLFKATVPSSSNANRIILCDFML